MNNLPSELNTPELALPESIEVTDVDQFTSMLNVWHAEKVSLLAHLRDVPEGTEVTIGTDTTLILQGDVRKAYQLGIELSLEELGKLPFEVSYEDTPPSIQ